MEHGARLRDGEAVGVLFKKVEDQKMEKITSSKTSAKTPSASGLPSAAAAGAVPEFVPANMFANLAKKFADESGFSVLSSNVRDS